MNGRLTITEVAKAVGVTPRTIMRWEKMGKIKRSKRDWRGWRFYQKEDIGEIKRFIETEYEYDGENKTMVTISKGMLTVLLAASLSIIGFSNLSYAKSGSSDVAGVKETPTAVQIDLDKLPLAKSNTVIMAEDVKYTLGPNDVIEIVVRRHPEFSGQYNINSEGKIEYKFVGDIIVNGLTKVEAKDRLREILSEYIIEPEIDVSIVAYLSKVFYVVGDVGNPGKFYMRGNAITVREALMQAGLPTGAASMRQCRLITPNDSGKGQYTKIDSYRLLYEGDLTENLEMKPGDVLYMPPSLMAKIIRVISPVTNVTGQAASVAATGAGF